MGKVLVRTLLAGLFFFATLIVLNRIDKPEPQDTPGERDLPPSSLEADNGAFWLLFLGEPESDGLRIEGKIAGYRRLLGQLERVERLSWQIAPRTKPLGVRYWQMIAEVPFPRPPERDWPEFLRAERPRLTRLRSELSVLIERYERMILSEKVADFGYGIEWDRSYALMSFIQAAAKLHAALSVLDAEDGLWPSAAAELLSAVRFGERLAAGAQSLFFYNLGRSIIDTALDAMGGLLNLPGCPQEVPGAFLDALPPIAGLRLSARAALVGEFLWVSERIERGDRWLQSELALRELFPGRGGDQIRMVVNVFLAREIGPDNYRRFREAAFDLFLTKNRTAGYFRDALDWLLALDSSPPFRWGAHGGDPPSFKSLNLWWLWNPSGRLLYESLDPSRQKRTIERGFMTRALYDLVRISARLHVLGDDAAREAGILPAGDRPWSIPDPFSGRPYRWDENRGLLWSLGIDGQDGGGDPATDLVLPVRLR